MRENGYVHVTIVRVSAILDRPSRVTGRQTRACKHGTLRDKWIYFVVPPCFCGNSYDMICLTTMALRHDVRQMKDVISHSWMFNGYRTSSESM